MSHRVCEVAVARPFLGTLAYSIPEALVDRVRPGIRVNVPLGKRGTIGVVDRLGLNEARIAEPKRLKALGAVVDDTEVVDSELLAVCRWIADYYVAPLGVVIKTALPPGLLGGRAGKSEPTVRTERIVRIIGRLETLIERDEAFGRAGRQREAYETLEALDGVSALAHLTGHLGFSRGVIDGLVGRGLARLDDRTVDRDPFAGETEVTPKITPTADQARVLEALREMAAAESGSVALLRGVTGSGKTLVYLELLETVLAAGKTAIVLVPEISLTPQTVSRFRARFGDDVAVLHSGLSDGERYDAWRALRDGRKRIAIGARSAIFAPVRNLGVIVVDEEHESSYKQSDIPRYHARSVAIMRARLAGCPCVLGSATPALESWNNAIEGRYRMLELEQRVTGHGLPAVELIDLKTAGEDDAAKGGDTAPGERGPLIISPQLHEAIGKRLAREEQAILLLNRRGYATFVECMECGNVWSCRNCSVTLTFHRRRRRLVCHHCGFEAPPPGTCGECGAPEPRFTGVGTEQVERRIRELFPDARVARMDLDTTASKWAHVEILDAFRKREVDLLLGTQMIAKGLDFPDVTLVGVINADVGLHIPDFRASERTFQLLEQVAGRAGRGEIPGEVLVQTSRPLHFALARAAEHDYVGFATRELEDRREPGYPPYKRLANLVVSGLREERVASEAESLVEWTRALISDREIEGVEVVGPAPCAIDRLRDRWRWHFLIKSDLPGPLGSVLRFLASARGRTDAGLRLEIDRDPESLL
ncbi:MAG: primosomal protein N' [Gemmatimonadota bacterium]